MPTQSIFVKKKHALSSLNYQLSSPNTWLTFWLSFWTTDLITLSFFIFLSFFLILVFLWLEWVYLFFSWRIVLLEHTQQKIHFPSCRLLHFTYKTTKFSFHCARKLSSFKMFITPWNSAQSLFLTWILEKYYYHFSINSNHQETSLNNI